MLHIGTITDDALVVSARRNTDVCELRVDDEHVLATLSLYDDLDSGVEALLTVGSRAIVAAGLRFDSATRHSELEVASDRVGQAFASIEAEVLQMTKADGVFRQAIGSVGDEIIRDIRPVDGVDGLAALAGPRNSHNHCDDYALDEKRKWTSDRSR